MRDGWTIAQQNGWLRIDDGRNVAAVEAVRIGEFGTVQGGFIVCTSQERMRFNCTPVEARRCIDQLWDLLAIA